MPWLTRCWVTCRLAARRTNASQNVDHRMQSAQPQAATVAVESPDILLGLKHRGKPPKLALYHSLDTRRIIKRCSCLVPWFRSTEVPANAVVPASAEGAVDETSVFGI